MGRVIVPSKIAFALQKSNSIDVVQSIINYRFKNTTILWEALQTGQYYREGQWQFKRRIFPEGNRPLAQVGDAVLRLVVVRAGYNANESPRMQRI